MHPVLRLNLGCLVKSKSLLLDGLSFSGRFRKAKSQKGTSKHSLGRYFGNGCSKISLNCLIDHLLHALRKYQKKAG